MKHNINSALGGTEIPNAVMHVTLSEEELTGTCFHYFFSFYPYVKKITIYFFHMQTETRNNHTDCLWQDLNGKRIQKRLNFDFQNI